MRGIHSLLASLALMGAMAPTSPGPAVSYGVRQKSPLTKKQQKQRNKNKAARKARKH